MKKYKALLVGICLSLLFTSGCGMTSLSPKENPAFSITDSIGHEEKMVSTPTRVVFLIPSLAEIYHAVGGDVAGIAATEEYKKPDYLEKSTPVGLPYLVNIEKVLSVKPDMVVGLNGLHNRYEEAFRQNHIPYLFFNLSTYDDVKNTVEKLAYLRGKEKEGDKVIREMEKRMEKSVASYDGKNFTYAALHGTAQGITLEVKGSIICDVASRLGLADVFSELSMKDIGSKPPFSLEELAVRNPDVIFLTTMVRPGKEKEILENLATQPAWQGLTAVKKRRVYLLPQSLFLASPGMNYSEAVDYLRGELENQEE